MASQSKHFRHLRKKWLAKHAEVTKGVWEKHNEALRLLQEPPKQIVAGSLAGVLMLSQPTAAASLMPDIQLAQDASTDESSDPLEKKAQMISELAQALPESVQPLTPEQKTHVAEILSRHYALPVAHSLDGKELNRAYGIIGAEQHLMRYPGDTMASHFASQEDAARYYSSGMAPGRGAWGYFTDSGVSMTDEDVMREKYYIAVQTFLSPGWNSDVRGHYQFFKYRKMLVVNPQNGKAVVAVIGDAGPAQWTGKQLGGSPEVMIHLERRDGRARGPVLYFFIDDAENTVPLGPITIQ